MNIERKHDERMVKVIFPLEQDDEGYPPAASEGLWARQLSDGGFEVDSVPWFVNGISVGDVVEATDHDGNLMFRQVLKESAHSTVRVVTLDDVGDQIQRLRQELVGLGCESELSHIPGLVSVDVPPSASLEEVVSFLDPLEKEGRLSYEVASDRTPSSSV